MNNGTLTDFKLLQKKRIEFKFWSHVEKNKNGCWEWVGSFANGYGRMWTRRNLIAAHRFSYELHNDVTIPEDKIVCHTCNIRSCVNPKHLYLGTQKDNNAQKEYMPKGEGHHKHKLLESDVVEIRKEYATDSVTKKELATRFGVTIPAICAVIARRTWKNV